MRTLSSALHVARHRLWGVEAWLWFVEIEVGEGGADGFFRLVRNTRNLGADGKVWQGCAFELDLPEEDGEGSLGEVVITLPNVSRLPQAYVEVEDEPLGRSATVYLQHESTVAAGDAFAPDLSWRHVVLSVEATEARIVLRCGHPAQIGRIPSRIFDRTLFPQLLPGAGISVGGVHA